jgi:hypothetical protein
MSLGGRPLALASRASILRNTGRRHGAFAAFGPLSNGGVTGDGLCNAMALHER